MHVDFLCVQYISLKAYELQMLNWHYGNDMIVNVPVK